MILREPYIGPCLIVGRLIGWIMTKIRSKGKCFTNASP